ncbi:hypothetical protein IR083_20825 [Dysgonomonas sp. GY75]|uniref:hypothetical protein n=1 Tax=Dysgonomonas sp. GY75 TaxID=2780419 RepID=UPI0018840492|nr:hypothetical protein [Dysgonomonas sp. GY75]MBF0651266.1 hypothetical protein [Dysgonomonas sp. GY75]
MKNLSVNLLYADSYSHSGDKIFDILFVIICIIFFIFQIILFFKLWGMTNDIREIKYKYLYKENENTLHDENVLPREGFKFKENDLVILISTGLQMRIKEITEDGKYACYSNAGMTHAGNFTENEIELFKKKQYKEELGGENKQMFFILGIVVVIVILLFIF